jgi:hypothetical protein
MLTRSPKAGPGFAPTGRVAKEPEVTSVVLMRLISLLLLLAAAGRFHGMTPSRMARCPKHNGSETLSLNRCAICSEVLIIIPS